MEQRRRKLKARWLLGEMRLEVKRLVIRGRGSQIKNPDKETKAGKEEEARKAEILTTYLEDVRTKQSLGFNQ